MFRMRRIKGPAPNAKRRLWLSAGHGPAANGQIAQVELPLDDNWLRLDAVFSA